MTAIEGEIKVMTQKIKPTGQNPWSSKENISDPFLTRYVLRKNHKKTPIVVNL